MTDAQMAYLAERRRAKEMKQPGEESNTAPTESPGASSQKYNGYGAFLNDGDDDDGLAVSQTKVEDCWKYLTGIGTIGQFLVFRHTKFGTIIELFMESSGGFSLQREQDAQVKYCSALCSMQDEVKAFAPQIVQRLCAGEGARLAQGVSAGAWGAGMVRANRTVFKAKVSPHAYTPIDYMHILSLAARFVSTKHARTHTLTRTRAHSYTHAHTFFETQCERSCSFSPIQFMPLVAYARTQTHTLINTCSLSRTITHLYTPPTHTHMYCGNSGVSVRDNVQLTPGFFQFTPLFLSGEGPRG